MQHNHKQISTNSKTYKPLNTSLFLAEHSGKQLLMETGPVVQPRQIYWQVLSKTQRSDSVAAYTVLPLYQAAY